MPKTILIADDDSTVVQLFHLDVEGKSNDVTIRSSSTGEDTVLAITQLQPDILVLDIRMPKGDGFHVLDHLKKIKSDLPVVVLTNYRNEEYREKSKTYANVKHYLVKNDTRMEHVMKTVSSYLN